MQKADSSFGRISTEALGADGSLATVPILPAVNGQPDPTRFAHRDPIFFGPRIRPFLTTSIRCDGRRRVGAEFGPTEALAVGRC
jgi:hypothetical protein